MIIITIMYTTLSLSSLTLPLVQTISNQLTGLICLTRRQGFLDPRSPTKTWRRGQRMGCGGNFIINLMMVMMVMMVMMMMVMVAVVVVHMIIRWWPIVWLVWCGVLDKASSSWTGHAQVGEAFHLLEIKILFYVMFLMLVIRISLNDCFDLSQIFYLHCQKPFLFY